MIYKFTSSGLKQLSRLKSQYCNSNIADIKMDKTMISIQSIHANLYFSRVWRKTCEIYENILAYTIICENVYRKYRSTLHIVYIGTL